MMKASFVCLRPEVTQSDVQLLKAWTSDREVTRFLNEENNISGVLNALLGRSDIPVLTPLFNRDGRFFMLCTRDGTPVGFMRMTGGAREMEMVLAIGDKELWGHGLGSDAIRGALSKAFFEWRVEKMVAYIHPMNTRSLRAFERNGFSPMKKTPSARRYELTMNDYLQKLRA